MEVLEYKYCDAEETKVITCGVCGSKLKITKEDLEDSRYYRNEYYLAGMVHCPVCKSNNFVNWYED